MGVPSHFFRYSFYRGGFILDIDYNAVGKRIAIFRKKSGFTQEQLAEKTELSTVYISHIENSRSIPSLETLMKLCAAMDVTPNELLLGTSQNRTDYLQTEVQQKLTLCTPTQRRLVNRFIDLLLEEAQQQQ